MPQKPLPEGIVALDELEILVVVDNETDTLSSVDEGVPQIPEVVHLAARLPPSRKYDGHECKTVFDQLCCACHGLSVLITGRSGGQRHRLLFDVGPYPDLWLENARRLAIDLSTIEYILLSHWHFDHSGGLPGVIAAIGKARLAAGLAQPFVDLHPDRPDQRGILLSGGPMIMLPQEPTFEDIRQAGGEILTHDGPHPICDGFFFGSGAIARVTAYEQGLARHHTFRGDEGAPDPLIMDERFVAMCLAGRGLTVVACRDRQCIPGGERPLPGYSHRPRARRLPSRRQSDGGAHWAHGARLGSPHRSSFGGPRSLYWVACKGEAG